MARVFFSLRLRLRLRLRWSSSHVRNANASARKWKIFHFLRRRLCLRLRLGSSHVYLLVLALEFASLVWTSLYRCKNALLFKEIFGGQVLFKKTFVAQYPVWLQLFYYPRVTIHNTEGISSFLEAPCNAIGNSQQYSNHDASCGRGDG